ncbi:MAG: hypothetical protein VKL39_12705 [Leptolyngbyaceae bacterium]|nr:hypothetical protein [Leptolyngbyaceae bacterium]
MSNKTGDDKTSKQAPQTIVTVDPATLVLIVSGAILLPLLLTGFLSH